MIKVGQAGLTKSNSYSRSTTPMKKTVKKKKTGPLPDNLVLTGNGQLAR
jgi:hypothetical protein